MELPKSYDMLMSHRLNFLLALSVVTLTACRNEDIATYRIPKETASPALPETLPEGAPSNGTLPEGHPPIGMPGGMTMGDAAAQGVVPTQQPAGTLHWTAPRGWKEKAGSGFRYVSFDVPGPDGRVGDLSVVVLDGEAGGMLSNINRWRDQIGLSPLTEGELPRQTRHEVLNGLHFTLVNAVSTDALVEGKYKKRLLAGICPAGGRVWFFKLVGEDALVRGAEKDFMAFLKSLRGLQ